jgi:hypothetical protein
VGLAIAPFTAANCLSVQLHADAVAAAAAAGRANVSLASLAAPGGRLFLSGGSRDRNCRVPVTLRWADAALGEDEVRTFRIRKNNTATGEVEADGVSFAVLNGADTTLDLGVLSTAVTWGLLLEAGTSAGGGAMTWAAAGAPVEVPSVCLGVAERPVFTPSSSNVSAGYSIPVSVSAPTAGSALALTVDGSDPRTSTSAIVVSAGAGAVSTHSFTLRRPGCTTVLAVAQKSGLLDSDVVSARFCISGDGSACYHGAEVALSSAGTTGAAGSGASRLLRVLQSVAVGAAGSVADGIYCYPDDCSPTYYQCQNGQPSRLLTAPPGFLCAAGAVWAAPQCRNVRRGSNFGTAADAAAQAGICALPTPAPVCACSLPGGACSCDVASAGCAANTCGALTLLGDGLRDSACNALVRVCYNDPSVAPGTVKRFVLRQSDAAPGAAPLAANLSVMNGYEAYVNLGNIAPGGSMGLQLQCGGGAGASYADVAGAAVTVGAVCRQPSATPSPTASASGSATGTISGTQSRTSSVSASGTPSPSQTPSSTRTASITASGSLSPSASGSSTGSSTQTPSTTSSGSVTATAVSARA